MLYMIVGIDMKMINRRQSNQIHHDCLRYDTAMSVLARKYTRHHSHATRFSSPSSSTHSHRELKCTWQTVKKVVVQRERDIRRKRLERKLARTKDAQPGVEVSSQAQAETFGRSPSSGSFGRKTRLQRMQAAELSTLHEGSRQRTRTTIDQVDTAVKVHQAASFLKRGLHKGTRVDERQTPTAVDAVTIQDDGAGVGSFSETEMPFSQDQRTSATEDDYHQLPAIDFEDVNALRRCVLEKAMDLANRGVIALPVVGWDGKEPGEQEALDRISFIFQAYKVKYYYYELLEMSRKVLMIGGMGMIYPNLPQQFAMGLAITGIWLVLGLRLQPWAHPGLNALNFFSLSFQALALFSGLLKKISLATKDSVTDTDELMSTGLQLTLQVLIVFVPASILIVENNVDLGAIAQRRLRSLRKRFASLSSKLVLCLSARGQVESKHLHDMKIGGGGGGGGGGGVEGSGSKGEGAQTVRGNRMCSFEASDQVAGDVGVLLNDSVTVAVDRSALLGTQHPHPPHSRGARSTDLAHEKDGVSLEEGAITTVTRGEEEEQKEEEQQEDFTAMKKAHEPGFTPTVSARDSHVDLWLSAAAPGVAAGPSLQHQVSNRTPLYLILFMPSTSIAGCLDMCS